MVLLEPVLPIPSGSHGIQRHWNIAAIDSASVLPSCIGGVSALYVRLLAELNPALQSRCFTSRRGKQTSYRVNREVSVF